MPKPFPPWEISQTDQFGSTAEISYREVPEYCWEWLLKTLKLSTSTTFVRLRTDRPIYQDFARRVKYELDKQDTIFGEVEVPKRKQKAKWKDDVTGWEKENFGTVSSQIPAMSVTEYKRQQALNQQQVSVEEQAKLYDAVNALREEKRNLLAGQPYPPYLIGYSPDGLKPERTATEISMIDADLRKQAEMMEALKATLDFVREKAVEKGYKPKPAKSEPVPTLKPKRKFQLDL